ncbi:MAG TPA: hypothetical protein VMV92_24705 [Streptosporangiaceae bacterium]|nr:hypothetical protein [Streptosporangiaceae bacterium]
MRVARRGEDGGADQDSLQDFIVARGRQAEDLLTVGVVGVSLVSMAQFVINFPDSG